VKNGNKEKADKNKKAFNTAKKDLGITEEEPIKAVMKAYDQVISYYFESSQGLAEAEYLIALATGYISEWWMGFGIQHANNLHQGIFHDRTAPCEKIGIKNRNPPCKGGKKLCHMCPKEIEDLSKIKPKQAIKELGLGTFVDIIAAIIAKQKVPGLNDLTIQIPILKELAKLDLNKSDDIARAIAILNQLLDLINEMCGGKTREDLPYCSYARYKIKELILSLMPRLVTALLKEDLDKADENFKQKTGMTYKEYKDKSKELDQRIEKAKNTIANIRRRLVLCGGGQGKTQKELSDFSKIPATATGCVSANMDYKKAVKNLEKLYKEKADLDKKANADAMKKYFEDVKDAYKELVKNLKDFLRGYEYEEFNFYEELSAAANEQIKIAEKNIVSLTKSVGDIDAQKILSNLAKLKMQYEQKKQQAENKDQEINKAKKELRFNSKKFMKGKLDDFKKYFEKAYKKIRKRGYIKKKDDTVASAFIDEVSKIIQNNLGDLLYTSITKDTVKGWQLEFRNNLEKQIRSYIELICQIQGHCTQDEESLFSTLTNEFLRILGEETRYWKNKDEFKELLSASNAIRTEEQKNKELWQEVHTLSAKQREEKTKLRKLQKSVNEEFLRIGTELDSEALKNAKFEIPYLKAEKILNNFKETGEINIKEFKKQLESIPPALRAKFVNDLRDKIEGKFGFKPENLKRVIPEELKETLKEIPIVTASGRIIMVDFDTFVKKIDFEEGNLKEGDYLIKTFLQKDEDILGKIKSTTDPKVLKEYFNEYDALVENIKALRDSYEQLRIAKSPLLSEFFVKAAQGKLSEKDISLVYDALKRLFQGTSYELSSGTILNDVKEFINNNFGLEKELFRDLNKIIFGKTKKDDYTINDIYRTAAILDMIKQRGISLDTSWFYEDEDVQKQINLLATRLADLAQSGELSVPLLKISEQLYNTFRSDELEKTVFKIKAQVGKEDLEEFEGLTETIFRFARGEKLNTWEQAAVQNLLPYLAIYNQNVRENIKEFLGSEGKGYVITQTGLTEKEIENRIQKAANTAAITIIKNSLEVAENAGLSDLVAQIRQNQERILADNLDELREVTKEGDPDAIIKYRSELNFIASAYGIKPAKKQILDMKELYDKIENKETAMVAHEFRKNLALLCVLSRDYKTLGAIVEADAKAEGYKQGLEAKWGFFGGGLWEAYESAHTQNELYYSQWSAAFKEAAELTHDKQIAKLAQVFGDMYTLVKHFENQVLEASSKTRSVSARGDDTQLVEIIANQFKIAQENLKVLSSPDIDMFSYEDALTRFNNAVRSGKSYSLEEFSPTGIKAIDGVLNWVTSPGGMQDITIMIGSAILSGGASTVMMNLFRGIGWVAKTAEGAYAIGRAGRLAYGLAKATSFGVEAYVFSAANNMMHAGLDGKNIISAWSIGFEEWAHSALMLGGIKLGSAFFSRTFGKGIEKAAIRTLSPKARAALAAKGVQKSFGIVNIINTRMAGQITTKEMFAALRLSVERAAGNLLSSGLSMHFGGFLGSQVTEHKMSVNDLFDSEKILESVVNAAAFNFGHGLIHPVEAVGGKLTNAFKETKIGRAVRLNVYKTQLKNEIKILEKSLEKGPEFENQVRELRLKRAQLSLLEKNIFSGTIKELDQIVRMTVFSSKEAMTQTEIENMMLEISSGVTESFLREKGIFDQVSEVIPDIRLKNLDNPEEFKEVQKALSKEFNREETNIILEHFKARQELYKTRPELKYQETITETGKYKAVGLQGEPILYNGEEITVERYQRASEEERANMDEFVTPEFKQKVQEYRIAEREIVKNRMREAGLEENVIKEVEARYNKGESYENILSEIIKTSQRQIRRAEEYKIELPSGEKITPKDKHINKK